MTNRNTRFALILQFQETRISPTCSWYSSTGGGVTFDNKNQSAAIVSFLNSLVNSSLIPPTLQVSVRSNTILPFPYSDPPMT